MTIKDFIEQEVIEKHPWTARWFEGGGPVIVQTSGFKYECKRPDRAIAKDIIQIGTTGRDSKNKLKWVGWDLDVGHGKDSYETTDEAIEAGRRILSYAKDLHHGYGELRLSKSGQGAHIRKLFQVRESYEDGALLAKAVADLLRIKACRSSLGRQAHWLWTVNPVENSFKLIESIGE